jgi:alpha,alpha-trehalose phosphorylase
MLKRALHELPEHRYPTDPWRMIETGWSERHFQRAETIFALSNGYIGVRGTPDECQPALSPGVYVNGFHETWPIVYAEPAYGLAKMGQTIVNVPDATIVQLFVDDEPLNVPLANLRSYSRVLDMSAGTLVRELEWSTSAGKHVAIRSTRLVSLAERHLMAVSYEVRIRDHPAPVVLTSSVIRHTHALTDHIPELVDPRVGKEFGERVLNVMAHKVEGERLLVGYRTSSSGMTLGLGVDHVVETAAAHETSGTFDEHESKLVVTIDAEPGVPVRLTNFISYQSSRSADPDDLVARCGRTLSRARRGGLDALQQSQRAELKRFWDHADVRVEASAEPRRVQQAVRWNLFQLAQATWRAEGSGVPAKGLTGSGYEGHYFWDTELCVLPFLAVTSHASRATCCASATACSRKRATERASCICAARCSLGERSTAKRRLAATSPALRSTT